MIADWDRGRLARLNLEAGVGLLIRIMTPTSDS